MSPEEAHRLVEEEGFVYIDVRSQREYAGGHPAGALNVPLLLSGPGRMTPNPQFMQVMNARFGPDAKLLIGCQSGKRSRAAIEMLRAGGFQQLADVPAGFGGVRDPFGRVREKGWQALGLPVSTDTPGGTWDEMKAEAGL